MSIKLPTIIQQCFTGRAVAGAERAGSAWREQHPVWDTERCFQCGICYLSCPDAAVVLRPDGSYDMDSDRCKGCGVCAAECPNDAISMAQEQ